MLTGRRAGGLIGKVYLGSTGSANAWIQNNYTMGSVTAISGAAWAGGLIGYIDASTASGVIHVDYNYSRGPMRAAGLTYEGGLFGYVYASSAVSLYANYWNVNAGEIGNGNCSVAYYYYIPTSTGGNCQNISGTWYLTDDEMKVQSNYAGWSTDVWVFNPYWSPNLKEVAHFYW